MELLLKLFRAVLEFMFPRDEAARALDAMTAEDLFEQARLNEHVGEDGVEAILSYKHPLVRRLMWLLKYEHSEQAATLCAELALERIMAEANENSVFQKELPILIPIPLSPARLRERGYNQTLRIAEKMLEIGGADFFTLRSDILLKVKDRPSQTKMENRQERLKNLADCFAVSNPREISGKNIFLLDDVTTTGATFAETKKTLLAAGVANVLCIAIAH